MDASFPLMGSRRRCLTRAREFLKEQRVLEPAEFRIARIVGEQRARAREHIFRRVAASIPNDMAGTLEDLLVVKPDETGSGLQAIYLAFTEATATEMVMPTTFLRALTTPMGCL
jgi:hypothetical protein